MNAQIFSGLAVGFIYLLLTSVVGLDSVMGAYLYGSGLGLLTVVAAIFVKRVINNSLLRFLSVVSIFVFSGYIMNSNYLLSGGVSILHNVFYISAMGSYLFVISIFSKKETNRSSAINSQARAEISNF